MVEWTPPDAVAQIKPKASATKARFVIAVGISALRASEAGWAGGGINTIMRDYISLPN